MFVSSEIDRGYVATMEPVTVNSGCGVSVPRHHGDLLESVNRAMTPSMRTVRNLRSAALALALMAGGAGHGASAQQYTTLAYGGIKCADWTSVRSSKPSEAAVYEAWILGFISAYNAFIYKGPNVAAGTDFDGLRGMVDDHCKKNPRDDLDSTAQALIKILLKKNPG